MGIQSEILLDPPHAGVYKSGQTVSGVLKYVLDKRKKFDSIVLQLKGKGKCSWSDVGEDASHHHGKEVYALWQEYVLRYHKEIDKGAYEYHFKFDLPINIPSSYKDRICSISYKIIAGFARPGLFTSTKKIVKEIAVIGCLQSRFKEPTIFGLTKTPFLRSSANQVDMKVEIEKTMVRPGENINLKYMIENKADIPVTGVKMKLIKEKTYTSDENREYSRRKDVDRCTVTCSGAKERSVVNSQCTVPTSRDLLSIQSRIFVREYKLHVIAQFPFPYKNASVEIPVVIGEKVDRGYP